MSISKLQNNELKYYSKIFFTIERGLEDALIFILPESSKIGK